MARRTAGDEKKGFKPLFEFETIIQDIPVKVQGTWKNDDKEASLYGFINLIIGNILSIKCSVVNGKENEPFLSFPQNKAKDGTYYNQVIPVGKEVAAELKEIAGVAAEKFDE